MGAMTQGLTPAPRAAAEIAELRWVGEAEAQALEVAPLARDYFLLD